MAWGKHGIIQEAPRIEEEGESEWTLTSDRKTIVDVSTANLRRQARRHKLKWANDAQGQQRGIVARRRQGQAEAPKEEAAGWKGGPMHRTRVVKQCDLLVLPCIEEDGAIGAVVEEKATCDSHEQARIGGDRY